MGVEIKLGCALESVRPAQKFRTGPRVGGPRPVLTARQSQVAPMVNEGFSDKEIAFRVGLAVGSVKRLNHEMYERIGVTGRVAFGKWYRENISASAAVLLADNNMRMGAFE